MNTSPLDLAFLQKALRFDPFEGDFGAPGDRVLSDKIVKVRKPADCANCKCSIAVGECCRSRTDVIDETVMSWRWCAECTRLMAADDHGGFEERLNLKAQAGKEAA